MGFPTEFPKDAVGQLVGLAKGNGVDAGRTALAVYDLAGYVLYQVFGDVKYLAGLDLATLQKITELFQNLNLDDLPKYAEIAEFVAELAAAGTSPWLIALRVTIKYGPAAASLVAKVVSLVKGL